MTSNSLPIRNRRRLIGLGGAAIFGAFAGNIGLARASQEVLRIGMTPAFLHDQHGLLKDWRDFMSASLRRPVEFVQRDSYRETMDLLRLEKLQFAWVCDYPYLHLRDTVRLMAVPLYQGKPHYRSYLIVHRDVTDVRSIADLAGRVFAYADPYSNTGYLAPRYAIRELGHDPSRYFQKTFFTWSHRKVVEAVASRLAHGGAVDSYIWETLARVDPGLASRTRLVTRSPEYGFPPFVSHRSVPQHAFAMMQQHLLATNSSKEGLQLLAKLYLDGFIAGDPSLYDGVAKMMRAFGET